MSIRVCPYTGLALPDSEMSWEHPIPESIGGGDSLLIRVQREANTRFGAEVDGPFVNSSSMRYHRSQGVRGKDGRVPWFQEELPVQIFGHEVQVPVRRQTIDGKLVAEAAPIERRFEAPGGCYMLVGRNTCAEADPVMDTMLEKLQQRNARAGKSVLPGPRQSAVQEIVVPSQTQLQIPVEAAHRFMAKAALGLSFRLFGDDWAASHYARTLRAAAMGDMGAFSSRLLLAECNVVRHLIASGEMRRATPFQADYESEHEIGFVPYLDGVVFHLILFGAFAARFRVNGGRLLNRPLGWGVRFREKGRLRALAPDPAFREAA